MAKQIQLKAKPRTETGKGPVKQLRLRGSIPGIVYGAHTQPLNIAIDSDDFQKALHHATSENVLVDLQVEEAGKTSNRLALIQEVQHHPVTDSVLHVDFHEVSATEKLRTAVPVRAIGEPAGVKTGGGILEYVMRDLRVECLPKDLPEVIEINVEALQIGQGIHVGDIKAPPGVTLLDQKEQAVFIVAAPITEEELAAMTEAAAATTAEPEVIGAKPEEGEEAAVAEGEAKPKAEAGKPEAKPAAGKGEAKPATGKTEAKPAAGAPAKAEAKPGAAGKPAPAGKPEAKK
jgi:large subunit ribosomal protein L25